MDSLKIPKAGGSGSTNSGGSSKSSAGSTPIAVRFNAGEESLDDIFQSFPKHNNSPGSSGSSAGVGGGAGDSITIAGGKNSSGGGGADSLSTSPSNQQQQFNTDEVNLRNNFLQGNFFNRKRSGSIEGVSPTASSSNLISHLTTADSTSVGTWRLIKGKVTQTIEDIKLSKSSQSQPIPIVIETVEPQQQQTQEQQEKKETDSDQENTTLNTSVSEELPLEQAARQGLKTGDSDSDIDVEILLDVGEIERSRLRRGLAHLKSKVRARSATHQQPSASTTGVHHGNGDGKTMKKELTPTPSSSSSLRGAFLRRRRRNEVEQAEQATPTKPPTANELEIPIESGIVGIAKKDNSKTRIKKEMEIESGVEMLEDMIPPATASTVDLTDKASEQSSILKRGLMQLNLSSKSLLKKSISQSSEVTIKAEIDDILAQQPPSDLTLSDDRSFISLAHSEIERISKSVKSVKVVPMLIIVVLLLLTMLPIHDFIRGIFASLLAFALFDTFGSYLQALIEHFLVTHPPEKKKFRIPDYKKFPICEVPAVEEHKNVRAYKGWMCEVNSYDPNNFHISMTKSIYVKLDGTILQVASTNARIPKRVVWNEPPIDRKKIVFTDHRIYNLLGCRVELLPIGLAKKRHFNRKYPIQLIIKTASCENTSTMLISNGSTPDDKDNKKSDTLSNQEFKDVKPPSLNESVDAPTADERAEKPETTLDFAATVLNANLQTLQDSLSDDVDVKDISVPCGDEVRLLLFPRSDREKEDWIRRFTAASTGEVHDQILRLPNLKLVDGHDLQAAATKAAVLLTNSTTKENTSEPTLYVDALDSENTLEPNKLPSNVASATDPPRSTVTPENNEDEFEEVEEDSLPDDTFDGLLLSSCAARNPEDYIRFMTLYQRSCKQSNIPVYTNLDPKEKAAKKRKRLRRLKRQQNDLWKGIDQSLFLGPSGSVVWANVMLGRILFSCINDSLLHEKIQDFLQKKLNSVKLPNFMENVVITQIHVGNTPPLIHRISQPLLDERGTWIDADVTYEGLAHITVTTKLNLLRLKRTKRTNILQDTSGPATVIPADDGPSSSHTLLNETMMDAISTSVIFDSDAESSGGSSTESESPTISGMPIDGPPQTDYYSNAPGNARRIFRIVDKIATSNFFQYATELSYVQRAMENMSANITLRVDLKGLVARATINMPPPPSDRIWLCFRGPPRLWISAKPTVGDKSVDWSIVTKVIESKLCEEVNKFLVFPQMVDVTIPFLGQPTYCEK